MCKYHKVQHSALERRTEERQLAASRSPEETSAFIPGDSRGSHCCLGWTVSYPRIFNFKSTATGVDVGSVQSSFGLLCTLHRLEPGGARSRRTARRTDAGIQENRLRTDAGLQAVLSAREGYSTIAWIPFRLKMTIRRTLPMGLQTVYKTSWNKEGDQNLN